jgi:hypothetical protein
MSCLRVSQGLEVAVKNIKIRRGEHKAATYGQEQYIPAEYSVADTLKR